jgi:hypothetical protein
MSGAKTVPDNDIPDISPNRPPLLAAMARGGAGRSREVEAGTGTGSLRQP